MSSLKLVVESIAEPVALMEGRLTLPKRGVSESSIRQAIALEQGDVVYEILSRKEEAGEVQLVYRALPKRAWQQLGTLPRHRWPLIPQEEKVRRRTLWSSRAEVLLLSVLSLSLLLAGLWQIFEISHLSQYLTRLRAMSPRAAAAVAPMPARPQETWVAQLNSISTKLSPAQAKLKSFEFTPTRAQINLESKSGSDERLRAALKSATGKEPLQTKGGVWQW